MEFISDSDKRQILSELLDGWLRFAANSLGIVGTLAKAKRMVRNGITCLCLLAEDLPIGEIARRLTPLENLHRYSLGARRGLALLA